MNNLCVICISNDSNDETIKFIKKLLEGYSNDEVNFKKIIIENPTISYKDLIENNVNIQNSTFIFGGHGSKDTLWVSEKVFYNENLFNLGPKCLFAFSCYSGKELGVSFTKNKENSFLGFNSLLAFNQDDEGPLFYDWMKDAFYPVITKLFQMGFVSNDIYLMAKNKLEKILHDNYEDESIEMSFFDELCLIRTMKSLCYY